VVSARDRTAAPQEFYRGQSNFVARAMKVRTSRDRKKAHGPRTPRRTSRRRVVAPQGIGSCSPLCIKEGEIDIVARRRDTVAFVEVKVRPTSTRQKRRSALSRRRISRAARLARFNPCRRL